MGTKIDMLDYISDFKCTGPACRNTCCQYWEVSVDKETFEKYNKVENKKLREHIKSNLIKYVTDSTYKDFAKIKLDRRSQKCPFLNSNNLCIIHKRLGEDYLCLVCQTYPRHYTRFPDGMECSLSLSCEEACRLALTSKNTFKVLKTDTAKSQRILIATDVPSLEKAAAIRDTRTYLLKVMEDTYYTLEQKLIIIGIFIESLKDQTKTDTYGNHIITLDALTSAIDAQSSLLNSRAFDLSGYFDHTQEDRLFNINLLKQVLNFKPGYYTDTYNNYRSILLNFINYDEKNLNSSFDISHYNTITHFSFKDFMEHNSYMLENYVKNYIYQNVFPFREIREVSDILEEYLILIFNYFFIKMHLMSLLSGSSSLEEDDVINLISCFSRNYENHFDCEEFILSLCRNNGISNLSKISGLIS